MDRKRKKLTETNRNGQKQTETDKNRHKRTELLQLIDWIMNSENPWCSQLM